MSRAIIMRVLLLCFTLVITIIGCSRQESPSLFTLKPKYLLVERGDTSEIPQDIKNLSLWILSPSGKLEQIAYSWESKTKDILLNRPPEKGSKLIVWANILDNTTLLNNNSPSCYITKSAGYSQYDNLYFGISTIEEIHKKEIILTLQRQSYQINIEIKGATTKGEIESELEALIGFGNNGYSILGELLYGKDYIKSIFTKSDNSLKCSLNIIRQIYQNQLTLTLINPQNQEIESFELGKIINSFGYDLSDSHPNGISVIIDKSYPETIFSVDEWYKEREQIETF